jgi:hypothetical protein
LTSLKEIKEQISSKELRETIGTMGGEPTTRICILPS